MSGILLKTVLLGALPLLVITLLQIILEKMLKIVPEITKDAGRAFSIYLVQFISDLLFFVIIPAMAYFWIYPVMPFSGYKAGIAIAIGAYILGSLPYATNISLRIKIPAILIVTTLFFNLLKLTAALGVVTHFLSF